MGTNLVNEEELTAGAIFAGIGGFCQGFQRANIKTIWAVENDVNAVLTYEKNFPESAIIKYPGGDQNAGAPKDICDVSVQKDNLCPVDILNAGFPCQSFSQAGDRKGFDDPRGKLFYELMRIVNEFGEDRPKVLVFENVPYLKVGDGGRWFAKIKYEIQSAGYWFGDNNAQILDPLELRLLPQRRTRLFMVATATNCFKSNKFTFPSPQKKSLPKLKDMIKTKDKLDSRYYLSSENRYYEELMGALSDRPEGSLVQYRKYYTRDIKAGVCPTLTANMGQGGHNVPFLRNGQKVRKLTEYECAEIQGFDDIQFPEEVSNSGRYMQIGNSVAVPVAELLGKQIRQLFKG